MTNHQLNPLPPRRPTLAELSASGPIGGYPNLQAMSESSFRHVRDAAAAIEATGLDVSAAVRRLRAERNANAAWWTERFVQIT